jgi:hypothetical protein
MEKTLTRQVFCATMYLLIEKLSQMRRAEKYKREVQRRRKVN